MRMTIQRVAERLAPPAGAWLRPLGQANGPRTALALERIPNLRIGNAALGLCFGAFFSPNRCPLRSKKALGRISHVMMPLVLGGAMIAPLALGACSNSRPSLTPSVGMREPASPSSIRSASPPQRTAFAETRGGGGGYKLGQPYSIGGVWYVPREEPNYDRTGVGSWYGADFHGKATANGEVYNMDALTAAHPTLPIPSYVMVTNLANNRTVMVRVNDRGPYVGGRMIDLSRAAARALGYETMGTATLRVTYAGRAPLNGDDSRERQYLSAQPWNQNSVAQYQAGPSTWQPRAAASPNDETDAPPNAAWSPDAYRRATVVPKPAPKPAPSSWLPSWGLGSGG